MKKQTVLTEQLHGIYQNLQDTDTLSFQNLIAAQRLLNKYNQQMSALENMLRLRTKS